MKAWLMKFRTRRHPGPHETTDFLAVACDACGAKPGEPCAPGCCAAPEDPDVPDDLAAPCPVCAAPAGVECAPGTNCGYHILTRRDA
jgi:hypothetical protein